MKLYIETHAFAPELNKVTLIKSGVTLKANNITTIKEARKFFFSPTRVGKYGKIIVTIEGNYYKTYQGYFDSYNELKTFLNTLRQKHNLPNTELKIKTNLIG